MKKILLAKKYKRILSRLIDMMIVIGVTIFIFLIFVFPSVLDREQIDENGSKITELYVNSNLFIVDADGNYCAKSGFNNVKELTDLYDITCNFKGEEYTNVSLTKSLFIYYTTLYADYGGQSNLTVDIYKNEILKVGSEESNIRDYDVDTNTLVLIDDEKADVTVSFFLNVYSGACKNLTNNSDIGSLTSKNQELFLSAFMWIIPVLLVVSLIFDLLIPILSPSGETIGKHIFKLGVISKNGYKLKKVYFIFRWAAYVFIELILGIYTLGATILISYTMFLFAKNRRCIHDFIGSTVVIDRENSVYFSSPKEESYYINRKNARG